MAQTSKASGKETAPATTTQSAGRMTLGAYAKVSAADATFLDEGERLNLQSSIGVEQRGDEVIITAEFKNLDGKVASQRRRISRAMLGILATMLEHGKLGWHVAVKRTGEKGQFFDFEQEER